MARVADMVLSNHKGLADHWAFDIANKAMSCLPPDVSGVSGHLGYEKFNPIQLYFSHFALGGNAFKLEVGRFEILRFRCGAVFMDAVAVKTAVKYNCKRVIIKGYGGQIKTKKIYLRM